MKNEVENTFRGRVILRPSWHERPFHVFISYFVLLSSLGDSDVFEYFNKTRLEQILVQQLA